jgi:acetylornithine/succinyldiaminopimelate/putrescine aminotransferase/predicted amino acid dehydrogenase
MEPLLKLDDGGLLRRHWGTNLLSFSGHLHQVVKEAMQASGSESPREVRIMDELTGLVSPQGATAEGRLYEIPMDALSILQDPERALGYIYQAVDMAAEWGARIVGLGSMTGIVGGRGTAVAERSSIAVTTGNSLTAYTALQNLFEATDEAGIDLRDETVVVVGIPGSIASVIATLLGPHCGRLLLVGRRFSGPAQRLATQLGVEFCTDIVQALKQSRVIVTATSTGGCIDQAWLRAGSMVIDVGVPTDIRGTSAERDDALVLTGGLVRVPEEMVTGSKLLWFQHGMIPSCLGETILLALENREECLSLGRELQPDTVQEIGSIARTHGFDFARLTSFGSPLDDKSIVTFRKTRARHPAQTANGKPRRTEPRTPAQLAPHAERLFGRYINPVLAAMNRGNGFLKTFVRGEGSYLFDSQGKRCLDFVGGFGSLNLGHNHPAVVNALNVAIREQPPGFTPTGINPYATALAERLVTLAPAGLEVAFFTNSGTESVEAAIKLARAATGRVGLLSCDGSFHGKSLGALSLTGNPTYQKPFRPLIPECDAIPYGDYESLERALSTRRFAAFIVEPIQGEGGMRVPPAGYLREAQALCRSTDTLLIVDEVQTGLGRTGTLFAVEQEDVYPDVMTLAKSLGGGMMPIGAMLARRDIWQKAYGTMSSCTLHTSTFGGGSLACAAGLATLDALIDEHIVENAAQRGQQLLDGLTSMAHRFQCIRQVRGRGLLLGIEFNTTPPGIKAHWHATDPTGMTRFVAPEVHQLVDAFHVLHAMQTLLNAYGIYTQFARSNPLVLRVEPPLTLTDEQTQHFLTAAEKTFEEIDYMVNLVLEMIAKTSVGKHDATDRAPISTAPNGMR